MDMRKQIGGLCILAQEEMGQDLMQPYLFVFVNSRRNLMKILYFDDSGFAMWVKRLEKSRFQWAKNLDQDVISISVEDMGLLLKGMNVWTRFEKLEFESVI